MRRGTLVDSEARRRAASDLGSSLCVEAGAGTGKTTLLVDRYLAIVSTGKARCGQIVAITFTEKAAGEMKYRLRRKIEELLSNATEDDEARTRLAEALVDLERAPISTIHSFAASILREHPIEAGIDPFFRQLDGIEAPILLDECWDDFLAGVTARTALSIERFLSHGGRLDHLRGMAYALYDRRGEKYIDGILGRRSISAGRGNTVVSVPQDNQTEAFRERIDEAKAELTRLIDEHCINRSDKGCVGIERFLEALRALDDFSGDGLEDFLFGLQLPSKRDGSKGNWSPPSACGEMKEIVGRLHGHMNAFRSTVTDRLRQELSPWFDEFLAFVDERKNAESFLDFDDLLIWTRILLRDARTLAALRDRYRFILVDEFQDTDPLQAEIIVLLAGEGGAEPGRLFIVGDPKQSIYRFRKADVEIYEEVKGRFAQSGSHLNISQNFRSVSPIVEWVNETFAGIITPPESGTYQPRYEPIRAVRNGGGPSVIELDLGLEGQNVRLSDVRRAEGEAIARLIRRLVEEQRAVWDPVLKQECPLSYRHIAVIYPGTTGIDYYERPLRGEEIPYIIEGGKLYYTRQEVRDIASVMRSIEDPWDQLALVASLRSPLFGFSDEELFLFSSAGGSFDYLESGVPEMEQFRDFAAAFRFLSGLHASRNDLGPAGTMRALLAETNYPEFCLIGPHGEQRVWNIRKILQNAREFEARGLSFRRFARWLGEQESLAAAEAESPLVEEDENAVRLLTVHKAKGLQFPVVILANLAQKRSRRANLLVEGGRRLVFKINEMQTGDYDEAAEWEERRDEAEAVRLLYVAATRAGDLLVIPRSPKTRSKSYLDLIEGGLSGERLVERRMLGGLPPLVGSMRPFARKFKTGGARERKRWLARLSELIEEAAKVRAVITPSGLVDHPAAGPPAGGDGDTARRFGLAFHDLMELLDISLETVPESLTRAVAHRYRLEGSDDLRILAEETLRSSLLREAASSSRRYREVPFTFRLGEGIIEGRIDLLYEMEGCWRIVDYKTDDIPREAVDDRFAAYRVQGACYALAASGLGIGPIGSVAFYFVRSGEQRTVPVTAALLARVEADLRGLSNGE
jgi:ATP-dependent helicase/nuclease subunit A